MIKVVAVRFRGNGSLYYFAPGDLDIQAGMHVIVETSRGIEYGMAVAGVREIEEEKVPSGGLKPVLRIADTEDTERAALNRVKEREALALCKEKIRNHNLDMKLIDAEYTFDNNKILFYFTADGRVDFRELVKDLASVFRTRIELRQIGVRDETKILGGIGICGRPLCCHSYLTDFVPVSIRMAKEQNLSLNPTKISGVCGRLMCCLKNEEATYEYLNSRLPRMGEMVTAPTGQKGKVCEINVLRQKVKIMIEEDETKEIQEYEASELKFRPRRGAKASFEETEEAAGVKEAPAGNEKEALIREERPEKKRREHQKARPAEKGGSPSGKRKEHRESPRSGESPRNGEGPQGEKSQAPLTPGEAGAKDGGEKRRPRRRHHNKMGGGAAKSEAPSADTGADGT